MILCGFIPMSDLCHITHSHLIHCVLKMMIRAALKWISVCIVVICIDWFKSYSIRIKGVNVQSFVVFILRSNTGLLAWCLLPCMLKSKKKDMMSRTLAGGGICMGGKTLQPGESESRGETGKLAVLHSPLTVSGSLCEADAAGFLFFLLPVLLRWMAGGFQQTIWSLKACVTVMHHRVGGWWFCLVILQINTRFWCVALMGIASYQWVMVCLAAHGHRGSIAG